MSERIERLRQDARAEALTRALNFGNARQTGHGSPVTLAKSGKVAPPQPGETACPRCGARASVGCKHARRA